MLKTYDAEVSWVQNDEPKALETEFIKIYFEEHDELPPFNAQSGVSNRVIQVQRTLNPIKSPINTDKVLESIAKSPDGQCDDCLSSRAGVKPRQTVGLTIIRWMLRRHSLSVEMLTRKSVVVRAIGVPGNVTILPYFISPQYY